MRKMNMGGSIPRQTTIQGQRHDLAYINPFEVDLLESYNATPGGVAGPGNVPAYPPGGGGYYGGYDGGFGEAGRGGQDTDAPGMGPGDGNFGGGDSPGGRATQNRGQITQADVDAANANNAAKAQAQAVVDNAAKNMALKAKGAAFSDLALSLQQQKDDAASKKGLAGLIARAKLAIDPQQKQQVFDDIMGKQRKEPGAFQSMLQKTGLAGPTPTQFEPVYDKQGNLVGSAGMDAEGNVVSYSGDRTANLADGPVKDRVDAMNEINQGGPGDGPDIPEIEMDPCPEGFVMDAETNVCVPVEGPDDPVDPDDPDDPPPYVPPSDVVGPPSYTPIGGPGSFVPTPLQPYPNQQMYQMMPPPPLVTMMVGEEQG